MDTKVVLLKGDTDDEPALREAGTILQAGGLVAFPTETVYGLGGDALNPDSSRKIYAAKGRPSDNPLIVHICRWEDIYEIAEEVPEAAVRLAKEFWPGPLTMILKKKDMVPKETTGGLDTVAVRFPSHPAAQKMIEYAGGFVAAPSANLSGRPSPTDCKYVIEDMQGRIEMILDGGSVGIGLESTIIDLTADPPQILRPGYVTGEMLERVVQKVEDDPTLFSAREGVAPRAPGMKYRHYAPKGDLVIARGTEESVASYINGKAKAYREQGERIGVICVEQTAWRYSACDVVKTIGDRGDEEAIARHLYRILREFDDENVTKIFSESFGLEKEDRGLGQAIRNRLLKAAGHQVVNCDRAEGNAADGVS